MSKKFEEYKGIEWPKMADDVRASWKAQQIFEKSISEREGATPWVFYEGPPSANGMPGIHHVMARTIKDIFCRYKTQQGYQVFRKAGWDTHGLPVELSVEKELGITKEDIGTKITVEEYNQKCQESVMRYTDVWNDLTDKMGYWVDMDDPYITYKSKYMESVWHLLKKLYDKEMIYKGYTIQPYSPKAGTGLSTHELNQPGCYRDVKDTTITAQFKVVKNDASSDLFQGIETDVFFLAWTTTPWTLPSNTALAVGPKVEYTQVATYNQYTGEPISVLLATALLGAHFKSDQQVEELPPYKAGDKNLPFQIIRQLKGADLENMRYEQLLDMATPMDNPGDAFRVILGDYVTTEDGTGIVHIAPTFGADDMRVAQKAGIPPMLVQGKNGFPTPLVDLQGKFVEQMGPFAGKYVKNEYYPDGEAPDKSVDVEIAIMLKEANRAFKVEKYEHSYPHCWRTDKPVLYYPLDSWFVRATAARERMVELNKTINWKPEATGVGRFGKWLENLNDWNLSRSRFWGIPIPIWSTEEGDERLCIGSVEELKSACQSAVEAGVMESNPLADFEVGNMDESNYDKVNLHRHVVDNITLVSPSGKPMKRESDLIDVWFDSGSMPYAQWHYPFENKEVFEKSYPADFIAEGVDQTRGWFYTLHAIGTMCFDSVAYKAVVSNGLVLDKNGQKMSKRLGNAVDPFETMKTYGPDATRWYMITNAQPWDNLKFDEEGIVETQRKFFRALHNTYSFFALYANVDGFDYSEKSIELPQRAEIDRWILSKLNTLVSDVNAAFDDFDPTKAGRAIQDFVVNDLSNWYVRLCRKRFWRGEYSEDKIAAYQTLYECLVAVSKLAAPIAPFYADRLYLDLTQATGQKEADSVHIAPFPAVDTDVIDTDLEERMKIAQELSSLVLGLRKKEGIRVRQPLQKIMVPVLSNEFARQLTAVQDLILTEVNVKELELLTAESNVLVKNIKPNFKALGPKYGKQMKAIAAAVATFTQEQIASLESNGSMELPLEGGNVVLELTDVDITSQDIPGLLVANEGRLTVALDIAISDELRAEGVARELVNRIQNIRKDSGLEVTDRINIKVKQNELLTHAVNDNFDYIRNEVLADSLELLPNISDNDAHELALDEEVTAVVSIEKV